MDLATALVRLAHTVDGVFGDVAREHDLTPQQVHLLCLVTRGPVGMTELSRSLHLEKSSLTGLVDRVERRGLVARTRDEHDRRACQIALTREGDRVAVKAHQDVMGRLDELIGKLPPADGKRLASVIAQMLPEESRT